MNTTLLAQAFRLAREAIDALHENAKASRELATMISSKRGFTDTGNSPAEETHV
jgi:hypothetical protein